MIFSVIEVNCSFEILQEINVHVIFLYLSSMRVCLCIATVPSLCFLPNYTLCTWFPLKINWLNIYVSLSSDQLWSRRQGVARLWHIRTCLSQIVAHNGGTHTRPLSSTTNTQIQICKHTNTNVFVNFFRSQNHYTTNIPI